MKLSLYFFGKKNEITDRENELIKRINFREKIQLIAIPQAGIKDANKAKKAEAESFLSKINNQDYVIAFDEHGQEKNSQEFSSWLKNQIVENKSIVFVIGGTHGLDTSIKYRANIKFRFGKMVWTRNLFRLMACEQIYRALEIDGGGKFHK